MATMNLLPRLFAIALLCASIPSIATAADETGGYGVGPKDVILVTVFGEAELTGEVAVGADGSLSFPLVGLVGVAGLTAEEVAEKLRVELAAEFLVDPHVSARVVAYKSQPVQVLGSVKKPGAYYLEGPTTLLNMLLLAEWVAEEGSGQIVVHRGDETFTYSVKDVSEGTADMWLTAHDMITLPEGEYVWVQGTVHSPGQYTFRDGLTISNAVTLAGGPGEFSRNVGYVLRDNEKIRFNLKRVSDGKDADLALLPGDKLFLGG